MYFYLNQLEPKLALTAFLSTEAGILVGVNYYRTTDFLSQHLKKKKKEGVRRLYYACSIQNPRNGVLYHVAFLYLWNIGIYLASPGLPSDVSVFLYINTCSFIFQTEQLLACIRLPKSKLQNYSYFFDCELNIKKPLEISRRSQCLVTLKISTFL